ncbi:MULTISPECIES: hypothetical protein [Deefgea]|uniref:Secreted protein n=1 Tax=Deefgea chitinilytica TaxID=570276 RepID=A0ABS2CF96_9NEIS|nr:MULTISPECIES: hypothetical protein [Deefgea]MBM5572320.1 hypothetical protein [Deefgea chitinilytica]MBM9889556.1 hypothetical protein [Deefgea sp. CFH1-16]
MIKNISLLKIILISFSILTLLFSGNSAVARSAIATIEGEANNAFASSYNYATQKEADINSIKTCKEDAIKNGIGHLANKCKITLRGKVPGFGAVTCGDGGCAYNTGYATSQDAIDAAYTNCNKSYKNCKSRDISYWEDSTGFASKSAPIANNNSCVPRSNQRSCRSSCSNGDCLVTYSNGCKIRVQVDQTFDPLTNQWSYNSPSC